jgi:ceramide glucosyltransferase
MISFEGLLSVWLPVAVLPFILAIAAGMWRLREQRPEPHSNKASIEPVDVVIPLKGTFPDQATILSHMLEQNYRDYSVIFVLESERDPAVATVNQLVQKYQHARKVIGGVSVSSAQKNHSLLAGLRHVRPEARILVFCDSTNIAYPEWLERFTATVRNGEAEAVTTFRSFKPEPETLGAICQAIYGTFVLLLAATLPKPWGGATAIRRETFERLNVAEAWGKTVVDDLVLGNALERGGIAIRMDTGNLLTSPLHNQTVQGFLSYLDRQILFPKFTNPGIWLTMLIVYLNLTFAFLVSVGLVGLSAAGWLGVLPGLLGCGFFVTMLVVAEALRRVNRFRISAHKWLAYFVPCMFFHAFVVVRSIFRNHIDWHGRRYWPGKEGVIVYTGFTTGNCSRELVLPPGTNAHKFPLQ